MVTAVVVVVLIQYYSRLYVDYIEVVLVILLILVIFRRSQTHIFFKFTNLFEFKNIRSSFQFRQLGNTSTSPKDQ